MPERAAAAIVSLCAALSAASPSPAGAQQPAAYSCVDPADPLARRWFQDEPCRLPMYHLPVTGASSLSEPRRLPTYPARSPESIGLHAMFWRFPVQPLGPYEAPRHGWR